MLADRRFAPLLFRHIDHLHPDALIAIATADAARAKAIADERAVRKKNRQIHLALEMVAQGAFGESVETLRDFGYEPLKPGKRTIEEKAAAVAKGKATRTARGASR